MVSSNKTLWESYGKYIILGLIVIIASVAGCKYWSYKKEQTLMAASAHYDKMLKAFVAKDLSKTAEEAETLLENYESTPYAAFAALMQGRLQVEKNELAKAEAYFEDAIELGGDGPAAHVGRVRLARVLAAENKLDEALKVLSGIENEGYVALYEETKGDIYAAQKNFDKARESYKAAEQALPPGVQIMALQLKQNDINKNSDEDSKTKANGSTDKNVKTLETKETKKESQKESQKENESKSNANSNDKDSNDSHKKEET